MDEGCKTAYDHSSHTFGERPHEIHCDGSSGIGNGCNKPFGLEVPVFVVWQIPHNLQNALHPLLGSATRTNWVSNPSFFDRKSRVCCDPLQTLGVHNERRESVIY